MDGTGRADQTFIDPSSSLPTYRNPHDQGHPWKKETGNTWTRREEREALTPRNWRGSFDLWRVAVLLGYTSASISQVVFNRFLPSFWKYKSLLFSIRSRDSFLFTWSNCRMNLEKMDHINTEKEYLNVWNHIYMIN